MTAAASAALLVSDDRLRGLAEASERNAVRSAKMAEVTDHWHPIRELHLNAAECHRDLAAICRAVLEAREWCRKWEAHEGVMPHELVALISPARAACHG
jgi:hypothetical protein